MRLSILVLSIVILLAELPFAAARDDGDGADAEGGADDEAVELAESLTDGSPQPDEASVPQRPAPKPAAAALATGALRMPGTVSIPTSVDRFGKKEQSSASAAAESAVSEPVQLVASVSGFGGKEAQPTKKAQAAADAKNAHIAADVAKHAAKVAGKVAVHTLHVTENAKSALKDATTALHEARVSAAGLSSSQRHTLEEASAKLKDATKESDARRDAQRAKIQQDNQNRKNMKAKMAKIKAEAAKRKKEGELEAMRKEIAGLRQELKNKDDDKAEDDALLQELQDQIQAMEEAEKHEGKHDKKHHDELKAEIERLRAQIEAMDDAKANVTYAVPSKPEEPKKEEVKAKKVKAKEEVEKYKMEMKPLSPSESEEEMDDQQQQEEVATPVEQKGIDIDTAMPYGDLEPFGREDTAQELTENSIKESDQMVDQLERAEVAEEKRSVFRALTRLRGAAITSFDGVARSQTGNIDEFNKIHQWRDTHPLHHLADEESDVSKWAFPDNAD